MAADIFISYRGADRVLARKLEHRLRSRWGSRVFRDETGLTAGRNWAEGLNDALKQANVIIALIGPGWHVSTDESVEDWVRKELASAVRDGKPILAVLVGNVDELRPKLGNMPEAFQRQAIVVGPELAGFDVHRISKAVGQLGEFRTESSWTLADRRDEMIPKLALEKATDAIESGKSLFISGSSGSGRNSLVRQLVQSFRSENHLVAVHGLQRGGGTRHTHAVASGWISSLSDTFQDSSSPYSASFMKGKLVEAVLKRGPDLLTRRVVNAATLLPLGGTEDDQQILEAVRRPTVRWAPFPPTRLRNQSRQVIELVCDQLKVLQRENSSFSKVDLAGKKLIFVIDHFDSVDSVSRQLVKDLVSDFVKPGSELASSVQFIIGAYHEGSQTRDDLAWLLDNEGVDRINIDDKGESWGEGFVLQSWLDAHRIELSKSVSGFVESESNPYRALAKLWYLVDNGYVSEPDHSLALEPKTEAKRKTKKPAQPRKAAQPSNEKVMWRAVGEGEKIIEENRISDETILDHMIQEHIPVGFQNLIEAGALLGRVFPFHAAYAAAHPGAEDDEPLSKREKAKWLEEAEEEWRALQTIDPDKSVIKCSESESGEYLVSLAQAELIGHLIKQLTPQQAHTYHARLARYLVEPVKELGREDYGREYYRAKLAARHWTKAGRLRDAADAHRHAAQLAEVSLAYGESQEHYQEAIRLYTQLIADSDDPQREHEDLLILANCFYRVGQTTRLSGFPGEIAGKEGKPTGAVQYLRLALHRLAELKTILKKNKPKHWPDGGEGHCTRGIPAPNLVRHYLRVYNAICGHVHLELAQCHEIVVQRCRNESGDKLHTCDKCKGPASAIRARLFDALRHAEAAQGEAGSRWLLAAASARLASLLADEALRRERENPAELASELAIEAFFHIERILGLVPYTDKEKMELGDPVSVAWRAAGRLFRHRAREPRIAEWCFRKMNDHGEHVTTTVDMVTDRWLGAFLLSICQSKNSPELAEARLLLERYRDWAIESGLQDQQASSHLRLYLLEFVASCSDDPTVPIDMSEDQIQTRFKHLDLAEKAARHSSSSQHERDCKLFRAVEEFLANGDDTEKVQNLLLDSLPANATRNKTKMKVFEEGVLNLASVLLRRVPSIVNVIAPELEKRIPAEHEDFGFWRTHAREYANILSETNRLLSPCVDNGHRRNELGECFTPIRRLAKWRLPERVFVAAEKTAARASELIREEFSHLCENEENENIDVLCRDAEYAALIHDWYSETDPARLLTLALEWNLTVTGEEWSNPRMLQGRLASKVLRRIYGAEMVLGKHRYDRITRMVENSVVGKIDGVSVLEKIFFLANLIPDDSPNIEGSSVLEKIICLVYSADEKEEKKTQLLEKKDGQTDIEVQLEKLESLYAGAISVEKQGLWEAGYVSTANEQTDHLDAAELTTEVLADAADSCESE